MKKILDVKGFAIGGTFLLVISGIGAWWFGIRFWQALLIGLACMVILGLIAAFENGDQQRKEKSGS
jgi:uncharacterized membrane protein